MNDERQKLLDYIDKKKLPSFTIKKITVNAKSRALSSKYTYEVYQEFLDMTDYDDLANQLLTVMTPEEIKQIETYIKKGKI